VVQELGRRARNRLERHGAFLRAAKTIAFAEGLDALTMQRLADEVDAAVGTVYTYFPSKSALVAELQREAIQVLDDSCARFEARFERDLVPTERSLTRRRLALVVGYTRFWVDTLETFPEEARLLQLLMSERRSTVDDQDVSRVLPAAVRILERVRLALDAAVADGALNPGDGMERTVVLAASLNGVLLLDHVARVDPALFDGPRLARALVTDLLRGWGAEPADLAAAWRRVDALAERGPLATRAVTAPPPTDPMSTDRPPTRPEEGS